MELHNRLGITKVRLSVDLRFENARMKILFTLLALVATLGTFSGSTEPVISPLRGTAIEPILLALHNGNSIFFNLSVGYLVSLMFWFLVVQYPESKRRSLLRDNLARQYQSFKESTIQILLWCSIGTHDSELPKQLCDHVALKEFFSQNKSANWYAAMNGLQREQHHLSDLLFEMELLASEVAYVLNNVSIQEPRLHASLKLLHENIHRLKNSSEYSYDQVKYVGQFLWGILARWSFICGQQEDDYIEKLIATL